MSGLFLCKYDRTFLDKSWIWLNDPYINYYSNAGHFTKEEQESWFNNLNKKNDYFLWGVLFQDKPIGACGLKIFDGNKAEYWGYIGEKNLFGQGLGNEMLHQVLLKAELLSLKTIILKVLLDNHRAISLYARNEFIEFGRDHFFIYMQKTI